MKDSNAHKLHNVESSGFSLSSGLCIGRTHLAVAARLMAVKPRTAWKSLYLPTIHTSLFQVLSWRFRHNMSAPMLYHRSASRHTASWHDQVLPAIGSVEPNTTYHFPFKRFPGLCTQVCGQGLPGAWLSKGCYKYCLAAARQLALTKMHRNQH